MPYALFVSVYGFVESQIGVMGHVGHVGHVAAVPITGPAPGDEG